MDISHLFIGILVKVKNIFKFYSDIQNFYITFAPRKRDVDERY